MDPVTLSLSQLQSGQCDAELHKAFGPDSLGVLLVSGLEKSYLDLRERALKAAKALASLPVAELQALENPSSNYLVGWSRGKEKLANGKPDINKGSFYVNCNFVRDAARDGPDPETVEKYPDFAEYVHGNIWPPSLPELEKDVKALITYMIQVTGIVASACDHALQGQLTGMEKTLRRIVNESDCHKARLLHYYIPKSEEDDWCGEHLDHSCLTALTSALWGPDPVTTDAGLWIRGRDGQPKKVDIPTDCIGIQTGSCLEELTHGRFKAVPHRVTGDQRYHRSTLAVFCQPRLSDKVGESDFATFARETVKRYKV